MICPGEFRPRCGAESVSLSRPVRHVRVRFDRAALRGWHLRLLERLPARRLPAQRRDGGGRAPRPAGQRRIVVPARGDDPRLPRRGSPPPPRPSRWLPTRSRRQRARRSGHRPVRRAARGRCRPDMAARCRWRSRRGGNARSPLRGRAPVFALRDGPGETVAVGRFGAESQRVMLVAFEDYLARTITLIEAALSGGASRDLPEGDVPRLTRPAPFDIDAWTARSRAPGISDGRSPATSTACASTASGGELAGAGWRGRTSSTCAVIRRAAGPICPMTGGASTPTRSPSPATGV